MDNLNQSISSSDNKSLFKDLSRNTDKLKSISFESSKTIPTPVVNPIPIPLAGDAGMISQVKPASTIKQIHSNVSASVSTQNLSNSNTYTNSNSSINTLSLTPEPIIDTKRDYIQSIPKSTDSTDSSNEINYEPKETPEIQQTEKLKKTDSK